MPRVTLRPGRERSLVQRHPWIFSGAVERVEGEPAPGGVVDIHAADGEWLARGTWSSTSQICARVWTWKRDEAVDAALIRHRLERAISMRQSLPGSLEEDAAYRLVFSESDGLPGLIVDRYGRWLVAQFLTQGIEYFAETICDLLQELCAPEGILDRSDDEMREREALPPPPDLRRGSAPQAPILCSLRQEGAPAQRFVVDLLEGQKTGSFLDQAENYRRVAAYCRNAEMLDGFCYGGGFTVAALAAGARSSIAIDSSASAFELLDANLQANAANLPAEPIVERVDGDMFQLLRRYRDMARSFDAIVLDPPKFARNQGQIDRAARGYKDINMMAMRLLRPGGILASFSCSGVISADLFQKILFGAAVDARRDVQILEHLFQPPDHPIALTFPESAYLKGFICRVW